MSYLFINDFKQSIQTDNLNQVINEDESILDSAMLDAQDAVIEFLSEKFILDTELADTIPYNVATVYNPGDRVYLDAAAYNAALTYALNILTVQNGIIYKCSTAIVVAEAFDVTHWTVLGNQYTIFSVPLPVPLFVLNNYYNIGNQVFWKGKIYTCQIASRSIDHTTLLQFGSYAAVPPPNIFPDDINAGVQFWGIGVAQPVTANTLPNAPWKNGDNRQRSLVRHCVNIALYLVHMRISPRNIPTLREVNYMGREEDRIQNKDEIIYPIYCALGWLQSAQRGNIKSGLQAIQPRSGGRIRFGSDIKNDNSF